MNERLYQRYAAALFSLAQDEKKVEEYQTALKEIESLFKTNPDLLPFLSSYAIEKEDLYAVIDKIWGKSSLRSLAPFLKVLVNEHVIGHFADVVFAYNSLANDSRGIKEGIVYSTEILSEDAVHSIEQALGVALGAQVALENRVDPGLLGGIKVAVDGKVFDGSLENKIESLRQKLLKQEGGAL
jgi:F-type H+-transporting ATPase subunit delta